MRKFMGESHPPVLRFLPDRPRRPREVGVMESADCNTDMVWPQVGLPKHRRSARRAKMHPNLSSLLPVADIDVGRSFGANMFLLVEGNNAEHRTGSPLTLATMAGTYSIRIGGNFDTQSTARAMRASDYSATLTGMTPRAVAATACRRARMSAVRLAPNAFSNCRCACAHPFIPARKRASPASVTRSSLLRRSPLPCSTAIRPSRCSGRMLRPSVVRSITISAARALIVIGPKRLSLARIENWVVRGPLGANPEPLFGAVALPSLLLTTSDFDAERAPRLRAGFSGCLLRSCLPSRRSCFQRPA